LGGIGVLVGSNLENVREYIKLGSGFGEHYFSRIRKFSIRFYRKRLADTI